MRAAGRVLLVGLALAGGSVAWAQNPAPAANAPRQPARRVIPLVLVRATLQTNLDAKKAKQGEPVRAKLEATVQIPQGPRIPRNTILEGRVVQVLASEHHSNSSLVITLDQARLKSGELLPVKVTVIAIAEPSGNLDESGPMPANSSGPLADIDNSRPSNFTPPQGSLNPPAPVSPTPISQGPTPPPPGPGVPGVTLKGDVYQPTSATFVSDRHNVHVPEGTQMRIAIGVIPKGVHLN